MGDYSEICGDLAGLDPFGEGDCSRAATGNEAPPAAATGMASPTGQEASGTPGLPPKLPEPVPQLRVAHHGGSSTDPEASSGA